MSGRVGEWGVIGRIDREMHGWIDGYPATEGVACFVDSSEVM